MSAHDTIAEVRRMGGHRQRDLIDALFYVMSEGEIASAIPAGSKAIEFVVELVCKGIVDVGSLLWELEDKGFISERDYSVQKKRAKNRRGPGGRPEGSQNRSTANKKEEVKELLRAGRTFDEIDKKRRCSRHTSKRLVQNDPDARELIEAEKARKKLASKKLDATSIPSKI